jgi:hypothetical protein
MFHKKKRNYPDSLHITPFRHMFYVQLARWVRFYSREEFVFETSKFLLNFLKRRIFYIEDFSHFQSNYVTNASSSATAGAYFTFFGVDILAPRKL